MKATIHTFHIKEQTPPAVRDMLADPRHGHRIALALSAPADRARMSPRALQDIPEDNPRLPSRWLFDAERSAVHIHGTDVISDLGELSTLFQPAVDGSMTIESGDRIRFVWRACPTVSTSKGATAKPRNEMSKRERQIARGTRAAITAPDAAVEWFNRILTTGRAARHPYDNGALVDGRWQPTNLGAAATDVSLSEICYQQVGSELTHEVWSAWRFTGELTVNEPAAFIDLVECGIGRSCAFGFGVPSLGPDK